MGLSALSRDDLLELCRDQQARLDRCEPVFDALRALPIRLYLKGHDSRFLFVNDATAAALGVSPVEAIGKTDEDFYRRNDAAAFLDQESNVLKNGDSVIDFETEENHIDGRTAWIQSTKLPLRRADGQIVGLIGLTKDVSEDVYRRRHLEQYQFAVDGAGEGLWYFDIQTEFAWFSEHWKSQLGYTDDELPNHLREWWNLIHPSDIRELKKHIQRHLTGGSIAFQHDYRLRHRNGKYRWIRARGRFSIERKHIRFAGSHTDITAIKGQEELYNQILDTIPNLVFMKEVDSSKHGNNTPRFTYSNRSLAKAFGANPEDIIGKTDYDFNDNPQQVSHFERDDQTVISTREPIQIHAEELTIGTCRRLLATIKVPIAIRDSEGNESVQALGIATDITELQRMQKQLEQERALLQALMDNVPDAIYFKSFDGRFIRVNREFARLVGLQHEKQAEGMTHSDLVEFGLDADHVRQVLEEEDEIIRSRKPRIGAERRITFHGTERYGLTDKVPITNQGNGVDLIVSISRDITILKQTERDLDNERQLLNQIIDVLPQCVFVKAQDSSFIKGNRAFVIRHGIADGDKIFGMTDFDFWPADQAERYRAWDREVMNAGQPQKREEEQHFADGRVKRIEIDKIPLRASDTGEVIGLVGIYEDITERQAEEKAKYQNHIVRTISHAIRGRIALLDAVYEQLRIPGVDSERALQSLYSVTRGLARAARSATQLSAHGRPKPRAPIPFGRMIQYICAHTLDDRINVSVSDANVEVVGVATDLENMFYELLSNAREFAPLSRDGGRIWVSSSVEGNWVTLVVADNGPGVASHLKGGRAFELFASADTNRTGMGLFLVSRVVENHGGMISDDEETPPKLRDVQTGARLVIRLPKNGKDGTND